MYVKRREEKMNIIITKSVYQCVEFCRIKNGKIIKIKIEYFKMSTRAMEIQ
jgi:hypothetical protein